MKKTTAILFVLFLAGLVAVVAAQGPGAMTAGPNYDPDTVETLKGTVKEVKLTSFGRGRMGGGVHLLVESGAETVEVHLGPQFFLEENDLEVEIGNAIEVTGSRLTMAGQPALIARTIRLGDYTLELRDTDGIPRWAGRGGRMMGSGSMMGGSGMGGAGMGPGQGRTMSGCQHGKCGGGGMCGHRGGACCGTMGPGSDGRR